MKALTTLRSAIDHSSFGIIALVLLTPVIFPRLAFAAEPQTSGPTAQFQIKISDSSILNSTPKSNNNEDSLSIETIANNDPLVISLKQYLDDIDSPLGEYAADIIQQPQWQRALAISYVESHMGRYCYDNNCSGIGVKPGHPSWRKYSTKLDWFIDLNNLLEKPIYKEKYTTFARMKGVYVQPGSQNWVNGAQSKYNQLMALTAEAEIARRDLAASTAALYTFSETVTDKAVSIN
jgi:hypothetical protein